MKNNNTIYIVLITVVLIVLEVIGAFYWKYNPTDFGLINIFLLIGIISLTIHQKYQKEIGFFSGHNFFVIFWMVWLFTAWWGKYYYVANQIWLKRNSAINFEKYFILNIFAIIVLEMAYHFSIRFSKRVNQDNEKAYIRMENDNFSNINKVINVIMIITTIVILIYYEIIGTIPFFYEGNIDEYRFKIQEYSSVFNYLNYFISILLMLKLYVVILIKKINIWDILIMSVGALMLVFYGAKMLVLSPIIVAFLLFYNVNQERKIITLKNIVVAIMILLIIVFYTNYRGLNKLVSDGIISDILLFVGGEFRDASRFVDIVDANNIYMDTIKQTIFTILPSSIENFISDVPIPNIGYEIKELLGYSYQGGSTRVGILAEMYVYGRWLTIFIAFLILGLVMGKIDREIINIKKRDDKWSPLYMYMLVFQISWLLVSETYIQLITIIVNVVMLFVLEKLVKYALKVKI